MKKILVYLFSALFISLWFSPSYSQQAESKMSKVNSDNPSILIVYLSRTQNTKAVADMIQQSVGGDKVALELVTTYPEHYQTMVEQVRKENQTNALPQLKTRINNISQYDIIFVGFPTWGMQLPPPMKRFFHQYDLLGKTVIPFNTNGGYGIGSSFSTVKSLCQGCRILTGISFKGGEEKYGKFLVIKDNYAQQIHREVNQWLRSLGFSL